MVTEQENKGASGATNQKLDIANESIQLAKDPNGKLPAESQIMGNVSSKVQSKENGSDSSTRTKSPQAGSANRRKKIVNKNSSNILEEDQSTSDGEGVDNGPNKVKPRPKIKKWKKQARSSGGESGNAVGQIGTKRPSSKLTWPSPNSKRIKTLSPLKQPHRRNFLSSPKAKLQLKLIDTEHDAVVGLEHMEEDISVYVEGKNFNFEYCFVVDRDGMGGGLALFWNAKDKVEIKSFSKHHIDTLVHNDNGKVWRCTGVYGHPETSQRHHTWTLLKRLADLFTTSNPSYVQIQEAVSGLQPKVTSEMNHQLDEPFTADEIVEALAQVGPTKAPGPDGLLAAFFQKHWPSTREGVIATCLHILNDKGNLDSLNHTHIALVPKVAKPRKVTEFRPISLCNVVYRIIAKTIANRLKPTLSQIISPTQSAFIPNRLITDNVIIGYECLHKIRHSKSKRNGLVALKLDISKAYDRVEWYFLEQTMRKLGFSNQWISLIMRCITTVSYSVIINGVPRGLIFPERGLRQGCPLSPYLFLLCAEVFSSLLSQAERNQQIKGLIFAKDVTISHLLFADDSLIFTKAAVADCKHLKGLFDTYAKASGQIFNFEKSSMFFSGKISEGQISAIKSIFKLKVVPKYERYLGLPSMIGRKKMSFFKDVKLKVLSKISSWHHKMFSSGGKEVLIKEVAQAIPAYAISVFKLPKGLCEDIQRAIAKFCWLQLPRLDTFKPISPPTLPMDTTVAELITADSTWNEAKLKHHFCEEDTEAMLKISLPPSHKEDSLLWHFDKKGEYTVKSGYQVALKLKFPNQASSSASSPQRWNNLWSLNLLEKIKIFMWRASKNLLPTAENLWKRKCLQDPICKRCCRSVETIHHALMECKATKKIWAHLLSSPIFRIFQARASSASSKICPPTCGSKKIDPRLSAAKAEAVTDAFQRARNHGATHIHTSSKVPQHKWKPPPKNVFKVNVDAAINSKRQMAGLGAVIRDSENNFVATGIMQTGMKESVSYAEAEAIDWGLKLARRAALSTLIIESDCLEVVELVNNTKSNKTGLWWIIEEIQNQKRTFCNVIVNHIPRTCNVCAHSLAKFAVGANTPAVWVDHIPAEVMNVLV
ncbi:reverse transcriptase domain-containing protein [Citrus sinensis]|nr:reverse transcriptase domain-containing protein [Citrus sinensis]